MGNEGCLGAVVKMGRTVSTARMACLVSVQVCVHVGMLQRGDSRERISQEAVVCRPKESCVSKDVLVTDSGRRANIQDRAKAAPQETITIAKFKQKTTG